jgi:hypothetical protein
VIRIHLGGILFPSNLIEVGEHFQGIFWTLAKSTGTEELFLTELFLWELLARLFYTRSYSNNGTPLQSNFDVRNKRMSRNFRFFAPVARS